MRRLAVAAMVAAATLALPAAAQALRPIPDTSSAIHIWEDQLPDSMTTAQVRFLARHIDGTQKVSLQTARRLLWEHAAPNGISAREVVAVDEEIENILGVLQRAEAGGFSVVVSYVS